MNIVHLENRKRQLLDRSQLDIICIQETGLRPEDSFSLPGYNIVRRDILYDGGVCILIHENLTYIENDWYI